MLVNSLTTMSSSTNSPQRFSGTYDSFYSDAAAAAAASNEQDVNNKMRVPKRIRVTGKISHKILAVRSEYCRYVLSNKLVSLCVTIGSYF